MRNTLKVPMYISVKSAALKSAGFFWSVLESVDSKLRPQFVHICKKNKSIGFLLLFIIMLGFLNLFGMF